MSFSSWFAAVLIGLLPLVIWLAQSRLLTVFADFDVELTGLNLFFLTFQPVVLSLLLLAFVVVKEFTLGEYRLRQRCDTLAVIVAFAIYGLGAYALVQPTFSVIDRLAPG